MYSCKKNYIEIVKLILDRTSICTRQEYQPDFFPKDINHENQFDETPLICACKHGHIEIVKLLLSVPIIDVNKGTVSFLILKRIHFMHRAIMVTST